MRRLAAAVLATAAAIAIDNSLAATPAWTRLIKLGADHLPQLTARAIHRYGTGVLTDVP